MENERNQAIKSIRIDLGLNAVTDTSSGLLTFQNEVLRPILKFQNQVILEVFYDYIAGRKIELIPTRHKKLLEKITSILHKDQSMKALMIGLVISLFDSEEIKIYISDKKEINKRIIAFLIERIYSQIKVEK